MDDSLKPPVIVDDDDDDALLELGILNVTGKFSSSERDDTWFVGLTNSCEFCDDTNDASPDDDDCFSTGL
jgi:hypothetical protein